VSKPALARPRRAPAGHRNRHGRRGGLLFALLAAALGLATACSTGAAAPAASDPASSTAPTLGLAPSSAPPSSPTSTLRPATAPVHLKTAIGDGGTFGVGMPLIAYVSKKITSAAALGTATTVTANGQPVEGGWYFEYSAAYPNYPIEGHWRPKAAYWPAHSQIHVDIAAKALSAGPGLAFDNSITLDYNIGAAHLVTVSEASHTLSVVSDNTPWATFPVSLGSSKTPTLRGIKVIMEKGLDIAMRGPGYYDPHVKFTQRLTYGGEYLHSAPWNCVGYPGCVGPQNNIGKADSSNGCTNLRPADANKLYDFLQVGDVVNFPDATGPTMQLGEGYGDWNVPWSLWQTGGLVPTTT
jgi:lipoprotein-anchoring transpeptidase ErfK/SrfK